MAKATTAGVLNAGLLNSMQNQLIDEEILNEVGRGLREATPKTLVDAIASARSTNMAAGLPLHSLRSSGQRLCTQRRGSRLRAP